ncbi:MAG: hypothetical protein SR3Q1_05090 [Quinella sp. 3Q1]|nr:hypothetical protein [Quinella sp. 3Q1]
MPRKIYIFITFGLHVIGGTQMYTAGKAEYLRKRGWQVYVFFAGPREGTMPIPSLNQYVKSGGGLNFLLIPPYKRGIFEQEWCLKEMLGRLEISDLENTEIIIESHQDSHGYWGELLASRLQATHFFVCCMEVYRGSPYSYYEDNLDFFYFKWKRNELIDEGGTVAKLFNGYKNITAPLVEMPDTVREQDAVQDVYFPLEKIPKLDWNICHIGRAEKDYVEYVITGVGALARRHPDKSINFIMVGQAAVRKTLLEQTFADLKNVRLTLLGDMVPIPRALFSRVDVVCAISQSALFAANEDVLTICGSCTDEKRTPGVLGYDTEASLYGEGTFSYLEALENVLVKKLYVGRKSSLPKLHPAEEAYEDFWKIVKVASPVKEYFTERLSRERIRDWVAIFPFGLIERNQRIILFGEGEISRDYRRQIEAQSKFGKPYCQVVATVDERPEEFDDTVVGVERLKENDYDMIVICTPGEKGIATYNAIVKIVPHMANKIICDFMPLGV